MSTSTLPAGGSAAACRCCCGAGCARCFFSCWGRWRGAGWLCAAGGGPRRCCCACSCCCCCGGCSCCWSCFGAAREEGHWRNRAATAGGPAGPGEVGEEAVRSITSTAGCRSCCFCKTPGTDCCCPLRTNGLLLAPPLPPGCGAPCFCPCCCFRPPWPLSKGCRWGIVAGCCCASTVAAAANAPCRVTAAANSSAAALSSVFFTTSSRASAVATPAGQAARSGAQWYFAVLKGAPPLRHCWVSIAKCSAAASCSCSAIKAGPRATAMAARPAGAPPAADASR